MSVVSENLKDYIRDIPDFPKAGIMFKDITPLLASHQALGKTIDLLCEPYKDQQIDAIVAAEARGFIFGAPMALQLETSFVPVRKPGKLPYDKHSFEYQLEYGTDTLEMHVDGVESNQNVLVVDDLLATGGTVEACCNLLKKCGANIVGCAFVIELAALGGAEKLKDFNPFSLLKY